MIECSLSNRPKYRIAFNPSGSFSVHKYEHISWWQGGRWIFVDSFFSEEHAKQYIAAALGRTSPSKYFK